MLYPQSIPKASGVWKRVQSIAKVCEPMQGQEYRWLVAVDRTEVKSGCKQAGRQYKAVSADPSAYEPVIPSS